MLGDEYFHSLKRLKERRDRPFESARSAMECHDLDWFEGKFGPSGRALEGREASQQDAWRKEAKYLSENVFVWHQAGLGRNDLVADFDYWGRMPRLKIDEVTLLSVGVEHHQVFLERLNPKTIPNRTCSADDFIWRRHSLVKRTFTSQLGGSSASLRELAYWVKAVNLDAHTGFLDMLERAEQHTTGETTKSKDHQHDGSADLDKQPEGREITSMAKLLVAIAITEYGYETNDRRSPIPREIQELEDLLGLSVSQDTIRKYLRTGAKHLPKDWKPDN